MALSKPTLNIQAWAVTTEERCPRCRQRDHYPVRCEFPPVVNDEFRTVDEGLNYFEVRMERLRTALMERNEENAQLEWSLFRYRLGVWALAIIATGMVLGVIVEVLL